MVVNKDSCKNLNNLFVQLLIKKGKKQKAEKLLLKVSQKLLQQNSQTLPALLLEVVKKAEPLVTFKKIRLKGSSYSVPLFLENQQRLKTALNWLRLASAGVKKSFVDKLVKELVSSSSNSGVLSLQRKELHQKANQNKVFAHYRWF
mgnify:FL=1